MRILRGLTPACPPQDHVVTIGSFDGLHLGHQALIGAAREVARDKGLLTAVLSFTTHPRAFFSPADPPAQILNQRDKCRILQSLGVDTLWLLPFRSALAQMSPAAFIDDILVERIRTKALVVGRGFRFGARRAGTLETLAASGLQHGFSLRTIEPVEGPDGQAISSSLIRTHLQGGRLAAAQALLGRPIECSGHVIHGQALGRTLGFPTINLLLPDPSALSGIYAVWVTGLGGERQPGVASIGRRPTVTNHGHPLLEVFLLDWQGDAYGKRVCVTLHEFIRPERHFDSLESLTQQMHHDREAALRSLTT